MLCFLHELQRTDVALWEDDVLGEEVLAARDPVGGRGSARRRCCQAVLACVGEAVPAEGGEIVVRREDLQRYAEHASPSTLYATFGRKSRRSLVRRMDDELVRALGLHDVVDQAVAETKTWSYRPYREKWLASLPDDPRPDRRAVVETLVTALAGWAADHPRLAVAGGMPPPSAVADLAVLCRRSAPLRDLAAFLGRVLALAAGPLREVPAEVTAQVGDELIAVLGLLRTSYLEEILRDLVRPFSELEFLWPRLDAAEGARLAGALVPRLNALIRQLGEGGDGMTSIHNSG